MRDIRFFSNYQIIHSLQIHKIWVKFVIALNSFLSSVDLSWYNLANREDQKVGFQYTRPSVEKYLKPKQLHI